ncbi:MAG: alkaline phosphatase D family protein [Opitutales bacterium]|nr:alkaline phosphatase D family protein [Opitutales bacterium]
MKIRIITLFSTFLTLSVLSAQNLVTHGPLLGHVTKDSVRIMARTMESAYFIVEYAEFDSEDYSDKDWPTAETLVENDNTAWITLTGLKPDTKYRYRILSNDKYATPWSTFRTLPDPDHFRTEEYNPRGLFNFSFEYGSCANQFSRNGIGLSLPTYDTMLREVADDISFAIMNGDWVYEEKRDYPVEEWIKQLRISEADVPENVAKAPTIVGAWENYKLYLDRGQNLSKWHNRVPSYFTFDDHELLNDIWGAGTAGRVDRRAVFRDIGTEAWYDYLAGANPIPFSQDTHLGIGNMEEGSFILKDEEADFSKLDISEMSNLHVHWGTPTAGVDRIALDKEPGEPNAAVYDIEEVIDAHTLRLSHPAKADGSVAYSIGRRNYCKFTVANCDFFLLDTRSHRQWHDTSYPDKPGLSILGDQQREWLKKEMQESEADFFFLVSSVPFMIPHIGAGGYEANANKDESWTVFLDEREKLIDFWSGLDQPVFVLTGDLHNSFAIKITDYIWEFCAGPHNSINHRLSDEGDRPATGLFQFDKREMDIRWSSVIQNDIPRPERMYPHYCVVQINNVYNNPLKLGDERWFAYEHPQVIFKYFDGRTGDFLYAETISTKRNR